MKKDDSKDKANLLQSLNGPRILHKTKKKKVQPSLQYLNDLCKVFAIEIIICLQEHLTQSRLSDWIIFGIELVETMESIPILQDTKWLLFFAWQNRKQVGGFATYCMHIKHIHSQIVSG